tara:strand:- start:198 stop:539 length:342 start_codon:yes stop_codon:yes gene_type:complete
MNPDVEYISTEIVQKYCANRGNEITFVDPALVLTVSQIVLEVLKLINSCHHTPQSIEKMCSRPSLGQRVTLIKAIREHSGDDDKIVTNKLSAAIIDRAGSLLPEEIEILTSSV